MKARNALALTAVFWIIAGLIGIVAPAPYLSSFGLGAPTEAIIAVRDGGVVLIGLGMINWQARAATGSTLRAILWVNILILIGDAVVNLGELAGGLVPPGPWIGSFAGTALFVLVLALGLRDAGRASRQRSD